MGCVAGTGGHLEEQMKLKRILMNEEGASPGGGAQQPPAPAQVPTQGAPAPASIPVDQARAVFGEMLGEFRNGLFADLRKAGAFKQDKSSAEPAAPAPTVQPTNAPSASPGFTAADAEAMIERATIIGELVAKNDLSPAQAGHMKAALGGVSVAEFRTKAQSYLTDMGLVKATTSPATATPNATPAQAPASAPAPAAAPSAPTGFGLPMQNGIVDIFQATDAQRAALGPAGIRKALEELTRIGNQVAGMPTRPKPPSQR